MIKSTSLKHRWDCRERLDGRVGAAGGLEQECRAGGSGCGGHRSQGVQGRQACETCGGMRVGGLHDWPDVEKGGRESRPR